MDDQPYLSRRPWMWGAPSPSPEEPYIELPKGSDLASWGSKEKWLSIHQRRQAEKFQFYLQAMDFLTENEVDGSYFEFGCHRARTFRMVLSAARMHEIETMEFYAFDSFNGLPKITSSPVSPHWVEGAFCTTEEDFQALIREHGLYLDKIHLIPGFYGDSLTNALRDGFRERGRPAALVTIDCDLYESARLVFDFIDPLVRKGSVIYLDDYRAGYGGTPTKGVALAYSEFCSRSDWRFTEFMPVGWWGRSFIAF